MATYAVYQSCLSSDSSPSHGHGHHVYVVSMRFGAAGCQLFSDARQT
jgi:hypothetical protein